MGTRGPAPKPLHMKLVDGTARSDRGAPDQPQPDGLPVKPEFADEIASDKWDELFPILDRMGVLTEADGDALALLCTWHAVYDRAAQALASYGADITFTTEGGYEAQRAEVGIMAKAADKLKALYREFGMTPSARTGVSVREPKKKSPLQKYVR